ncbi:MAG: ribonuclease Z [Flavobacteriaceae bacterium]|jgi:ribonuclease Z|nr:ribonuclease Z [Flavobacteriaceae bacterium]
MELTILGCYSATPRPKTHPTSQVLSIKNHLFLIDCGEGTQVQLRRYKVKFSRIKHIFISHLHGDHYFGLIGLISTFMLLGREAELNIYGPKGIKELIMLQLKLGKAWFNYPLSFHELESKESEIIFEDDKVIVITVPLKHRVYTNGFVFKEKLGERKINIEAIKDNNIDMCYLQKIKQGSDIENNDGKLILNKQITFDPEKPKSYAFCSDTQYYPACISTIKNVTVLYHESSFLDEHEYLCVKTWHSTARQAALIAKEATVDKLILGHYSTRYPSIDKFKAEAKQVFDNVELAEDGKKFII